MKAHRSFIAPRNLIAAFVLGLSLLLPSTTIQASGPPASGFMYTMRYGDSLNSLSGRFFPYREIFFGPIMSTT